MSNGFSDTFKKLRNESGMTQADMAKALGISRSSVGMYENGEREPSFELLETIADYFNVSMNYLMTGKKSSEYYFDQETAQVAQEIFENKELRALFDTARDSSAEDIQTVHSMLLALKRKERGNDDTGC